MISTLSDPMDCSSPGSSVHGIFQATVLEWGAIAFSSKGTGKYYLLTIGKGVLLHIFSQFLCSGNKISFLWTQSPPHSSKRDGWRIKPECQLNRNEQFRCHSSSSTKRSGHEFKGSGQLVWGARSLKLLSPSFAFLSRVLILKPQIFLLVGNRFFHQKFNGRLTDERGILVQGLNYSSCSVYAPFLWASPTHVAIRALESFVSGHLWPLSTSNKKRFE